MLCIGFGPLGAQAQYSLPESTVDFTLQWNEVSNSDVVLSGVDTGYDVENQTYLGWCVDMEVDVQLDVLFEGSVLNLSEAPAPFEGFDWNRILYILNHKQGGRGDVQLAIWFFTDENSYLPEAALAMVQDAMENGEGYVPQTGEIGAILLLPSNANIQVMIFEVPMPEGDTDVCIPPPRTIGYWKNHIVHLGQVLQTGSIDLGDYTVTTAWQAVCVLRNASAHDARGALRAQLLATILNLRNGSAPEACGVDIEDVVAEATQLLREVRVPIYGKHPDRAVALELKNLLDCFNNSGAGQPNCEEQKPDRSPGRDDDDDDDDRKGKSYSTSSVGSFLNKLADKYGLRR